MALPGPAAKIGSQNARTGATQLVTVCCAHERRLMLDFAHGEWRELPVPQPELLKSPERDGPDRVQKCGSCASEYSVPFLYCPECGTPGREET